MQRRAMKQWLGDVEECTDYVVAITEKWVDQNVPAACTTEGVSLHTYFELGDGESCYVSDFDIHTEANAVELEAGIAKVEHALKLLRAGIAEWRDAQ